MLARLLCCLLLLSCPAFGLSIDMLEQYYQQLRDDPQSVVKRLENQRGKSANVESNRCLLLANASLLLHNGTLLQQHLEKVDNSALSPMQRGWQRLIEAEKLELLENRNLPALAAAMDASGLLIGIDNSMAKRLYLNSLLVQARIMLRLERLPQAHEVLRTAQQLPLANEPLPSAQINSLLGQTYRRQGQFQLAVDHFQVALTLEPIINDPRFSAILYLQLGYLYRQQGDKLNAEHYIHRAAELSAERFPILHSIAMEQIALTHEQQQQYEMAVHYLLLAINALNGVQSPLERAKLHLALSRSYSHLGNFSKAQRYLKLAEDAFIEHNHHKYLRQAQITGIELAVTMTNGERANELINALDKYQLTPAQKHQLQLLKAKTQQLLGNQQQAWQLLLNYSEQPRTQNPSQGVETVQRLAEHHLRQQLEQQQTKNQLQQREVEQLQMHRAVQTAIILLLLAALTWNIRRRRLGRMRGQQLRHLVFHHDKIQLPNRNALISQLPEHQGMLVLLQLGDLPYMELQLGSLEFLQLRQQIALRLGNQEGLKELYETSPGRFALLVEDGLGITWLEALIRRVNLWPLRRHCGNGRIAIGAIETPFQPGSMLQLPTECSVQLAQLALLGALEQSQHFNQHAYLLLQPATLNAPVLNPDAIYQSAQKSIHNGVIRCLSNLPTGQIRWPSRATSDNEIDVTNNNWPSSPNGMGNTESL